MSVMLTVEETNVRWAKVKDAKPCLRCKDTDEGPTFCKGCIGTGLEDFKTKVLACKTHGILYTRIVPPMCSRCGVEAKWVEARDAMGVVDKGMFDRAEQRIRQEKLRKRRMDRRKRKAKNR